MLLLTPSVSRLFKWRQFEPGSSRWGLAGTCASLCPTATWKNSLRSADFRSTHLTVWRWVQRYAPEIQRRLRPRLRPTNDSWRVDETYVRVKSSGCIYLGGENHPAPRVINTDEHAGYPPAIVPPLSLECEISLDTVILDEKRGVRFCRRRFLNASGIARQGKG